MEPILWGLYAAIIAQVWAVVLAHDDTPLKPFFKLLHDWHERGGWRAWISSPLGGCVLCCAGQIGLWSYSFAEPWAWGVSIFNHVLAASSAVLFAIPISRACKWIQRQL